ncbi:MAG: molybdopterin molybdotransferase MoeA [Gemmatimonadaceae bacterium]|nr:molybdopterin molybdotransferase MoeA [Gemmatimonadaceae bacterium]
MTADDARLSVAEATALILTGAEPLAPEVVPLGAAQHRVLAAAVRAPRDLPPWRNASMDGYAVRAADLRAATPGSPRALRVVESIAAGALPTRTIGDGEAARIMTGAPLPDGADSVIRIEDTDRGTDVVQVRDARDAGMNVRPRGEDLAEGAVALDAGHEIDAAALGVLAAVGAQLVTVHRRPRVAVLSAGDELVPLADSHSAVATQRIVDVNSHTIAALARDAGAEVHVLGLAADDPHAIRTAIEGAAPYDVLITSGGVSVGDHDHTRAVLRELGADILIHRLRIRPGAPLGFGLLDHARWVGLPGNPVSAMVTFELFVRPLLRRLAGHHALFRGTVPARTTASIRTAAPLTHFLRAELTPCNDGIWEAALTGPQGSGLITSMVHANALLIVPESQREVEAGTVLRAMLLGERALHSSTPVA